MVDFLEVLGFSFSVTGPIFIILALGILLKRVDLLTDAFIDAGSRLVFTISLPVLLFINVSKTQIGESSGFALVGFGVLATIAVFVLLEFAARRWVMPERDRGVVVQGGFRSNMGAIGLAYCVNAYGPQGLATASLYLGLVTIVFNVLAVLTLSHSLNRVQGMSRIFKGIASNPLIIGIVLALPFSWFGLALPAVLMRAGEYVADLTLPLALLCTGAALNFKSLRLELANTVFAAGAKLVLVPLFFSLAAMLTGFRGIELGVLMLMSSAPTAAASYVMVRAMGGNAALAANIVALTTLGSLLTTTVGIVLLRGAGLI